jgi:hypothetical protein
MKGYFGCYRFTSFRLFIGISNFLRWSNGSAVCAKGPGGQLMKYKICAAAAFTLLTALPVLSQLTPSTPLPEPYFSHQLVTSSGYLYNVGGIGGINGALVGQKVFYAPIESSGGVGAWTETTPLPEPVFFHSALTSNGFVYVLGGYHCPSPCGIPLPISNIVYFSRINSDGSLGAWQTTTPLPETVFFLSTAVAKGAIYEMGGWNGQALTAGVYSADIHADGTLGAWIPQAVLPTAIYTHATVSDGQALYVTGGVINNGTQITNTVYYSKINPDKTLAGWSQTTPLPQPLANSAVVLAGGRIYLTGGWNGAAPQNLAISANLNADETLGNWSAFGVLPDSLYLHAETATDRFLFVDGGTDGINPQAAVYFMSLPAPLNTPAGPNVSVQPADASTGTSPVALTFSTVTQGGVTSLTTSSTGPTPLAGFTLGNPPVYYSLATTAVFSGPISICINYTGITFTAFPQLYHYSGSAWVNVTTSVDPLARTVCGTVTSLSPFALFAPLPACRPERQAGELQNHFNQRHVDGNSSLNDDHIECRSQSEPESSE